MNAGAAAGGRWLQVVVALSLLFFGLSEAAWSVPPRQGAFPAAPANNQAPAPIAVSTNLVVLHATVSDKKGGFVSGLDRQDFQVYEDGQPQTIQLFQHEDVPVAAGLVVDNSGSMESKKSDVAAAALAFVKSSNAQDEMFVVNFNEHVTFGLPNTELFSAKPEELKSAVLRVPAAGKTALYDAIEVALAQLKKATRDKKVLIVISDGGDNASRFTLAQALQEAEGSDAIIYTIGLFDEYDNDKNPRVLKQIARATGGETFLPEETGQVVKICGEIARDIRNQYTIGYTPANQASAEGYRTIKVVATGSHGRSLEVRTRTGYLASPDNPSARGKNASAAISAGGAK